MTDPAPDLQSLVAALEAADIGVAEVGRVRPDEARGHVPAGAVPALGEIMCGRFGAQLVLMAGEDLRRERGAFAVHYLFAHPRGRWLFQATVLVDPAQPEVRSLAPVNLPASRFERELRDLFGIAADGHPDPRPLVRHGFWPERYHPLRKDAAPPEFSDDGRPFPFTAVGGEGVFEIPVGPVHAGVIEPGHFRFSVMGETIIDMKSRLYFTHKGTEKLFEGRTAGDGVALAERVSGDTSVGHALAFCQAIEAAAGVEAPRRARHLRVLLLELERLYNHVADFGMIVSDTGFALAAAHGLRIRERLLRVNKRVTGSRLLRGTLAPGGLAADLLVDPSVAAEVRAAFDDFREIVDLSLENTLVLDRLDGTGVLSAGKARDHGALGYVGRASGVDLDARRDHPFAAYGELAFDVPVMTAGDVRARALVRVEEARQSVRLVDEVCASLPPGPIAAGVPVTAFGTGDGVGIGLVEGWRGRIVHWVRVAADGRLERVKIVDPSFFNWPALSDALENNIVPDFPLCNKSFNQSYSGNDL
jgi:Ni,Fe-hydrogenase III large subunit/Ni,Fe-hydrogenase III component G